MTILSRIAKYSFVPNQPRTVDFHLKCSTCKAQNRVRLNPSQHEVERDTCSHFHDYSLASLREGVVYFRFSA